MKYYLQVLLAFFIFVISNHTVQAGDNPLDSNWKVYSEKELNAQKNNKPALLYFWAEWCGPCHQLRRLTLSNLEVQKELKTFSLFKIDCTEESPELEKLQEKYNVVSLPVIVFIDKYGKVQKEIQLSGFEAPVDFLKRLKKFKYE